MNRKNFARSCLLVSVLGLAVMYASTQLMRPETVSPGDISRENVGENFRVEGNVSDFYRTDSASFFTLNGENSSIQVVDFERRSFPEGSTLTVTGRIDLYQGELELVSTRIEQ